MIMLIFSMLIFLPYCIVEMYGTANRSKGGIKKNSSTITFNTLLIVSCFSHRVCLPDDDD